VFRSGPRIPLADRFWTKVNKDGPPHPTLSELGPCWLWTASTVAGYGQLAAGFKLTPLRAHVVAWEMATGTTVEDLDIGHTCDVRPCVRNDERGVYVVDDVEYPRWGHLFLTTHIGNMRDRAAKRRQRASLRSRLARSALAQLHASHETMRLTAADVVGVRMQRGLDWRHLL